MNWILESVFFLWPKMHITSVWTSIYVINRPQSFIEVSFRDVSLFVQGTKNSLSLASPVLPLLANTACDPVIEEHFRRSLGKNYKEPEPPATNSVSITGSVDDHFAKALGETWLQIKNKGSPLSSSSSPNSSPDSHMVNHNHSPSVVSWSGEGFKRDLPRSHSHPNRPGSNTQASVTLSVTSLPEGMPACCSAKKHPTPLSLLSLSVHSERINQAITTFCPVFWWHKTMRWAMRVQL